MSTRTDALSLTALAARDGDPAATSALVCAVRADVVRVCLRCGGEAAVDDLVQETMVRVVAALGRFRADGPAREWVLGIATRVCADRVRTERRRAAAEARLRQEPYRAAPVEAAVHLWDLLDRLDHDRRAAFVATQVSGLRYEEAAVALGVPIGTVRSRVARARLDLLQMLGAPTRPGG